MLLAGDADALPRRAAVTVGMALMVAVLVWRVNSRHRGHG
jgi:hypothetical protein